MNTDDVDRRTVLPRARAGAANDTAAARDVSLVFMDLSLARSAKNHQEWEGSQRYTRLPAPNVK